jgi:hypothetical protein
MLVLLVGFHEMLLPNGLYEQLFRHLRDYNFGVTGQGDKNAAEMASCAITYLPSTKVCMQYYWRYDSEIWTYNVGNTDGMNLRTTSLRWAQVPCYAYQVE